MVTEWAVGFAAILLLGLVILCVGWVLTAFAQALEQHDLVSAFVLLVLVAAVMSGLIAAYDHGWLK